MGLLDGNLDPQTASVLALAGGLLSPGSFGQGLSRGIAGQQAVLGNAQDLELKKQQVIAAQQDQQIRAQQMRLMQMKLDDASSFLGGASPASSPLFAQGTSAMGAANAAGSMPGPTNAAAALQQSAPAPANSRIASVSPDQAAARLQLGLWNKETYELWKASKEGMPFQPGYRAFPDGRVAFNGDPTKGITLDGNGNVAEMPKAGATIAGLAGQTKEAETRAVNRQTPVPIERLDRQGAGGSLSLGSSLDDLLNPAPAPAPAAISQLSPQGGRLAIADMKARGQPLSSMTVNGSPAFASASGFKSASDLAAEKMAAEKGVQIQMDPILDLRKAIPLQAHSANQAAMTNLADTTNNEGEIVARNNRLLPYLAKLPKIGGFGQDERTDIANNLKQFGVPDSITTRLAGGDPEAAKIVANQLSAAAIQTMLDTLNKEGKPNRVMYQALKEQQEGLAAGKNVLAGVMALQKQLYEQHQQQLGTMTDLMSAPDYNPVKFQYQFATQKAKQIDAQEAPAATMRWNPKTGKIESK